jgi:hypothetical protein
VSRNLWGVSNDLICLSCGQTSGMHAMDSSMNEFDVCPDPPKPVDALVDRGNGPGED